MKTNLIRETCSRLYGIQFNEISIEALFRKYEETGFIYPAKKSLLDPYFQTIVNNWEQLIKSEDTLLWILSKGSEFPFSSVTLCKQSNFGLMAQHLVSTGNPALTLELMLASQYCASNLFDEQEIRSGQNWFRPDNRYAYRIFASMYDKMGPQKASLRLLHYLHQPIQANFQENTANNCRLFPVTGHDADFVKFVQEQYGNVFATAEELNEDDIELNKLGAQFSKQNLIRYRRVYKVVNDVCGTIVGAVIANRAPLGLNFSFLENRAYYIFSDTLPLADRLDALLAIHKELAAVYADFTLGIIPIVTDELTSAMLQNIGGKYQRAYMQSIWLRSGFQQYYEHIQSFLEKIRPRLQSTTVFNIKPGNRCQNISI